MTPVYTTNPAEPPEGSLLPDQVEGVYDFVVLGRGPSGIAAADSISRNSSGKLLCLEARNRDGGNTHTNQEGVDEGAAWIHTVEEGLTNYDLDAHSYDVLWEIGLLIVDRLNEMSKANKEWNKAHPEAKKPEYEMVKDEQRSVIYFDGKRVDQSTYFEYLKRAHVYLIDYLKTHEDTNIEKALADFNNNIPLNYFLAQCEFGQEISGLDLKDASVSHAVEHMPCAAGYVIQGGLGNFIKQLGESTRGNTTYGAKVTGVFTDASPYTRIEFTSPDGKTHVVRAKHVINTIPPTVFESQKIKNNFPKEKIQAAENLPRGQMNKIILHFEPGYLEKHQIPATSHLQVGTSDGTNIFFLARPFGQEQLMGLIGGKASVDLNDLPPGKREEAALQHAVKYLRTIPGFEDVESHIIKERVLLTGWSSDPLSKGSYLNARPGAREARGVWASAIGNKVFFAGESTASGWFDGLQTHVTGALMTGYRAASDAMGTFSKDTQKPVSYRQNLLRDKSDNSARQI